MMRTNVMALMAVFCVACGDDTKNTNPTATDASTTSSPDTSFSDVTTSPPTDTSTPSETSQTTTATDTSEPPTEVEVDTTTTEPTDVEVDSSTTEPTDVEVDSSTTEPTDVADDTTVPDTTPTDTTNTPAGESCANPFVVPVPPGFGTAIVLDGDTTGAADDHSVAEGACAGLFWALGEGSPDQVWSFTAPTAGSYHITLMAETGDLGFYVLNGCTAQNDGACLRGADTIGNGVEAPDGANVALAANQTVSIVVDSFVDASTPASSGAYQLIIDPRKASPLGDTCGNAITLQSGPGGYVGSGDTSANGSLNDDLNALECAEFYDGFGVQDQVWKFTAPTAGNWNVTVTPSGGSDPMVYFHRNAQCNDTCSDLVDDLAQDGVEQAVVSLTANEVLFIVVDAWQPEAGGPYVIKVAQGCTPVCTPGSCADNGCGQRCDCADNETCNTGSNQCVCNPDCSGNVCNVDNGCGGTCACSGTATCENNVCVTPTPGDTCADARAMTALGGAAFSASGDLATRDDDASTGTCATLGGFPPNGTGTPDEFWSFNIAAPGTYRILLEAADGSDEYFALYSGSSCATCVGAVDLQAAGGIDQTETDLVVGTYVIAVDATSVALAGQYLLSVEPVDDVPIAGDGCTLPYPLIAGATPGTWAGSGNLSLVDQTDDDEFETQGCSLLGTGSLTADGVDTEDEVFQLDVTTAGNYKITVTPDEGDVFVQVLSGSDCDTAMCRGYRDAAGYDQPEIVTLNLAVGTHFIVVDTYLTGEASAYTVLVEAQCTPQCVAGSCADDGCGTPCACGDGETCVGTTCEERIGHDCSAPIDLTTDTNGNLVGTGNLGSAGAGDDFTQIGCADLGDSFNADGDGTDDEVFGFSVAASGDYRITVAPSAPTWDLMWGLQVGAVCETSTCVGYLDEVEDGAESAIVALTSGQDYWLVVEPFALTTPGAYSVTVELVPVGPTGETCESPNTFTDLGVPVTGTTTSTTDDYNGLQCSGAGANGTGFGDVVYRLDAPYGGTYSFALTPSGGADLAMYAFAAATGTCNNFACIDGSNDNGANGVEVVSITMNQGSAAYVVVDGATVAGDYTLRTTTTAQHCASDLIISEYIEGSSNNKALELYNGTAASIDLSQYTIRVQQNGTSGSPGSYRTRVLSGQLAAGATFTMCRNEFAGLTCTLETGSGSVLDFNGNDSIAIIKGGNVIDIFGIDGEAPSASWPIGSGTTLDHTIVRKPAVSAPASTWNTDEWIVLDKDVTTNFGSHAYFWGCTP